MGLMGSNSGGLIGGSGSDESAPRSSHGYDAIAALEDWKHQEKCRRVKIKIDDGYGATCWRVELHRGKQAVFCSETNFLGSDGVNPLWHEHEGNLYCVVVEGDAEDWPGLAKTIQRAIECADKFFVS